MRFSIITAVWNRAGTIGEAMQSLQAQRFCSWEHLVQEGYSWGGTLAAIRSLAYAQTSLESAPDDGIYDALNKGIRRARGEIIGLLHSDDLFEHQEVLKHISEVFEQSDIDGIYGDLVYVAKDDSEKVIRYWRAGEYNFTSLRRGWMPPHPTLFLRREIFERYGSYDTSFRISADYEAILRWLVKFNLRLVYIPEVLVRMRVGGASNRSLKQILYKMREDYQALRLNQVGGIGVIIAKNLRKISQFVIRARHNS